MVKTDVTTTDRLIDLVQPYSGKAITSDLRARILADVRTVMSDAVEVEPSKPYNFKARGTNPDTGKPHTVELGELTANSVIQERASELQWWWLSFCDSDRPTGEQFLGACVVDGGTMPDAVRNAHHLGCNPGGEVMGIAIELGTIDRVGEKWRRRLLNRDECEAMDAEVLAS